MLNQKTKSYQAAAGLFLLLAGISMLILPFIREEEVTPDTVIPPMYEVHHRFLIGMLIRKLLYTPPMYDSPLQDSPSVLLIAVQILIGILLIAAGKMTERTLSVKSLIVSTVVSAAAAADLVCALIFREKIFGLFKSIQFSFGFWAAVLCIVIALIGCICSLIGWKKQEPDQPTEGESSC